MKFVINKIIVPSVLMFFSLVFCLVAGEIVVRKLNLIPTTSIKVKELSPSKLSYLPNSSWQYSEPEFTENVQINSIGYRDYEPQFESPSILFLGDSQTYGTGVQLGERASDIVAKHIESHCEFGKSNVLNISMPGSSTKKELMMLEEALSKGLKISHIFLMVVSNDHSQNYYEDRDAQFKLGNQVVGERKQVGLKTKIVKNVQSL